MFTARATGNARGGRCYPKKQRVEETRSIRPSQHPALAANRRRPPYRNRLSFPLKNNEIANINKINNLRATFTRV